VDCRRGGGGFCEHRRVAIDADDPGSRPALGEELRDVAGPATEIDDSARQLAVKQRQEVECQCFPGVSEFQIPIGVPGHWLALTFKVI
jgi:hypothetical protein